MGTNNKTISKLSSFNSELIGTDLFIISKDLSTRDDNTEYVSYKLQYDTLTANLFKALSGNIRDDISTAILHGALASCDYLYEGKWNESTTKGIIPLSAVLYADRYATYSQIDLAKACEEPKGKTIFTGKLPIKFVDHPFKRIATYQGLDLELVGTSNYPLSGKLDIANIDYNFGEFASRNGLNLSLVGKVRNYPLSGKLHVDNITGLLNLAYKSFISLSNDLNDGALTSDGILKDSLPSSRVYGLCALAAMDRVYLNDKKHVVVPTNALALSAKTDLRLSSLAAEYKWKYYTDLGLNSLASADLPIRISNTTYLTGQLSTSRIDGLTPYINDPIVGYILPVASSTNLGGIKTGTNDTDSLDHRDFKINVNSLKEGYVRVNYAKPSSADGSGGHAGLMSPHDKYVVDNAMTSYTLPRATKSDFGGIKIGDDVAAEGSKYNVNLYSSSGVGYVHINNAIASNTGRGYVGAPGLMTAQDKELLYSIPTDEYSLPKASGSHLGGIMTEYPEWDKFYKVQVDTKGRAYVHVPWTDTSTTYTAGEGIIIDGNVIKATNAGGTKYSSSIIPSSSYTYKSTSSSVPSEFFEAQHDCILNVTIICNTINCLNPHIDRFSILEAGKSNWTTLHTFKFGTNANLTTTLILKAGDKLGVTGICGGHPTKVTINGGSYLTR